MVVPAGKAIGEVTGDTLIGLVGESISGYDSMPPLVVVTMGKAGGFNTWEAVTGLIRGELMTLEACY